MTGTRTHTFTFNTKDVDPTTKEVWISDTNAPIAWLRLAADSFWYVYETAATKVKAVPTGYQDPDDAASAAVDALA